MNNSRIIKAKHLGATNYQPNRISLSESRYNKTDRTTVHYTRDTTTGTVKDEVLLYLKEIGQLVGSITNFL